MSERNGQLKGITSPDQLSDYIRIASPSSWVLLGALVILLVGGLIFSIVGRIDVSISAVCVVQDGYATCFVSADHIERIAPGMRVMLGDGEGTVGSVPERPIEIGTDFDAYARYLGQLNLGDWCYQVPVDADAPDGVYQASIVTEQISPLRLVAN